MSTRKLSRSQIDAILCMAQEPEEFVLPRRRGKYRWNSNTGLSLKRAGMVEVQLRYSGYAFRILPEWRKAAIDLLKSGVPNFADLPPAAPASCTETLLQPPERR